jgi:hypothetical protein
MMSLPKTGPAIYCLYVPTGSRSDAHLGHISISSSIHSPLEHNPYFWGNVQQWTCSTTVIWYYDTLQPAHIKHAWAAKQFRNANEQGTLLSSLYLEGQILFWLRHLQTVALVFLHDCSCDFYSEKELKEHAVCLPECHGGTGQYVSPSREIMSYFDTHLLGLFSLKG